jgi:hypothetical protein
LTTRELNQESRFTSQIVKANPEKPKSKLVKLLAPAPAGVFYFQLQRKILYVKKNKALLLVIRPTTVESPTTNFNY